MKKLDDILTATADIAFLLKQFSATNKDLFERLEAGEYTEGDLELLEQLHKSLEQAAAGHLDEISIEELMEL